MKALSPGYIVWVLRILLPSAILVFWCLSCSKDDEPAIVPPDNGELVGAADHFLFACDDVDKEYYTRYIGQGAGPLLDAGNWDNWSFVAGVESGHRAFVLAHFNGLKQMAYMIRSISPGGELGAITESGNWHNSYETLIGFHLGEKGFIFGQDSDPDHRWFVQEVTPNGRLAANESDNGNWANYYAVATPLYVNGKTYLYFQTQSSDNYWFIAYVSPEGKLSDVCDGHWGHFWNSLASVEVDGNTYLIGHHNGVYASNIKWFIQRINRDGTMGEETDSGTWSRFYEVMTGYTNAGKAYLFVLENEAAGSWNIRQISSDGKLGGIIDEGNSVHCYKYACTFTVESPGGFRYSIGWDLSRTNGGPTRSWSSIFTDPWTGGTKFGGGAALADIDRDAAGRYDATLMGIADLAGADRFYYKVAWNLDATGKAASWSQKLYGPPCGEVQAGGGADIWDIDGSGKPDLLLMSVDDPEGANSFRYFIGWNLSSAGLAASWSNRIQGPSIGDLNSGGGAALGDIDNNGRPELVLMGINNPDQANSYWYLIGKNLNKAGFAESWSPKIAAPCDVGWNSAGGGAALSDINGNGKPDLVLMNIDSPTGTNVFWCYVGWDIDMSGYVTGWSSFTGPAPGWITAGGGAAVADIDKNGKLDLLLMSLDDPYGKD